MLMNAAYFVREVLLAGHSLQYNLTLALIGIGMGLAVYLGWRNTNPVAALSGLICAALALLYAVLAAIVEPGGVDAVADAASVAVGNFRPGFVILPLALLVIVPSALIARLVWKRSGRK